MKILQIIAHLSSGGGERFVVDLVNEQSRNLENQVKLLTVKKDSIEKYSFYKKELSDRVAYHCLNEDRFSLRTLWKVYRFVKKEAPDVVHIHLSSSFRVSLFALFFYRKPLYVQTLHGRADQQYNNYIEYLIKRFLYSYSWVKLITISDDNDKSFKRIFHTNSKGIIYNGRAKLIIEDKEKVKDEINRYKMDADTLVIIHVARYSPVKNQKVLINSFNNIIKKGANAILLVIGYGFDFEEGKEIKDMAGKNIFFLGLKQYVADYLLNSDAFVLSSLHEAMPISLIEALACGCIPLSTPVSGCVDIINNGVNGFLADDFTQESLEEMLERFIANHDKIDRNQLIELYKNKFSMKECVQQYINFYSSFQGN